MFKNKLQKRSIWKSTLWQALLVVGLFWVFSLFQDHNIIREAVEDSAFDPINKFFLSIQDQRIHPSHKDSVIVFSFDTDYMRENKLFDAGDHATHHYGYVFPREKIADFIKQLDRRTSASNCPKALFIDFNLNYPSNVNKNNNNSYSAGDKALIETLSQPRCYAILLVKSGLYQYIEQAAAHYPQLQQQIDAEKIIFVSPYLHVDDNGVIRRYQPVKEIYPTHYDDTGVLKRDKGVNTVDNTFYPAAAIALWQLLKNDRIDRQQARQFIDHTNQKNATDTPPTKAQQKDRINVNANRIWIRNYKAPQPDKPCGQRSYWQDLTKYSLNCDIDLLFSRPLADTVLLLGGTEVENTLYSTAGNDDHKVLKFWQDESMSGVDIHANALMTLLYLDKEHQHISPTLQQRPALPIMEQLPLLRSLLIVLGSFVLLNLLSTWILIRWQIENGITTFFIALIVNTIVLFCLSLYLLQAQGHFWFNWIIPLLLFQLIEGYMISKKKLRALFNIFVRKPLRWIKKYTFLLLNLWRNIK